MCIQDLSAALSVEAPVIDSTFTMRVDSENYVLRLFLAWEDFDMHRTFLPEVEDLLLLPSYAVVLQLQIKIPQHTCQNQAHFCICEAKRPSALAWSLTFTNAAAVSPLTKTIARAQLKWLQYVSSIARELWIF